MNTERWNPVYDDESHGGLSQEATEAADTLSNHSETGLIGYQLVQVLLARLATNAHDPEALTLFVRQAEILGRDLQAVSRGEANRPNEELLSLVESVCSDMVRV